MRTKLRAAVENPELLSFEETAESLDLTVGAFTAMRHRGKFIEPCLVTSSRPFWSRQKIARINAVAEVMQERGISARGTALRAALVTLGMVGDGHPALRDVVERSYRGAGVSEGASGPTKGDGADGEALGADAADASGNVEETEQAAQAAA